MDELERVVTQHGEQIKTIFAQLKEQSELIKGVNALALSVRDLAGEQTHLRQDVSEMRDDVDELKSKPAKRWESITEKVIWALMAAVIGFALARVGL